MFPFVSILTSRLTGPIASVLCVLLLAFGVAQCSGRVSAERGKAVAVKERDTAKRDLGTCRANTQALDAALTGQNKALAARSAEDTQRLSDATKRLGDALRGREKAEARAASLIKTGPVGIDACARAMDAFQTVKEQAR